MTHEQIDALSAGPELDALACAVVGWEPKRPGFPRMTWREMPEALFRASAIYRPISTDISTAMEALEVLMGYRHVEHRTAFLVTVTCRRQTEGGRLCRIWEQSYGAAVWAEADTVPLAIARALAKTGARR